MNGVLVQASKTAISKQSGLNTHKFEKSIKTKLAQVNCMFRKKNKVFVTYVK